MKMRENTSIISNVKITVENVITGKKEVVKLHNTACAIGKTSLAGRLIGASKGEITYMALGTGDTGTYPPDASDVELASELFRKQISVRSQTDNVAHFRTFYNTSEANGVLTEIGLFGDNASGTADSGTLFARASINKTKTSSETITIDWDITIN